jgi:hypothetical protein
MYSPKINPEHIPVLYRIAKAQGIPMTKLVDQIISDSLSQRGLIKEEKTEYGKKSQRWNQQSVER